MIGELALGSLKDRADVLTRLTELDMARKASDEEVLHMIEAEKLYSLGVGYVDVHLLAAALLTDETQLWTRDKRLKAVADRLGIAHDGN